MTFLVCFIFIFSDSTYTWVSSDITSSIVSAVVAVLKVTFCILNEVIVSYFNPFELRKFTKQEVSAEYLTVVKVLVDIFFVRTNLFFVIFGEVLIKKILSEVCVNDFLLIILKYIYNIS